MDDFWGQVSHTRKTDSRDLRGVWLDRLTSLINKVHITGEPLLLPGYGKDHPTLEIFSYDKLSETIPKEIKRPGIAHIAFEVDDVKATLKEIISAGGSSVWELVIAPYLDSVEADFV